MSVYIHIVHAHMYLEERGSETFIKHKTGGMCDQIIAKNPISSLDRSENVVFLPIVNSLDLPDLNSI
jgi:hypothetical protein